MGLRELAQPADLVGVIVELQIVTAPKVVSADPNLQSDEQPAPAGHHLVQVGGGFGCDLRLASTQVACELDERRPEPSGCEQFLAYEAGDLVLGTDEPCLRTFERQRALPRDERRKIHVVPVAVDVAVSINGGP